MAELGAEAGQGRTYAPLHDRDLLAGEVALGDDAALKKTLLLLWISTGDSERQGCVLCPAAGHRRVPGTGRPGCTSRQMRDCIGGRC